MLGEKLITLRKKHGYSQQELADKLSVTRQTISNWECGQGAPALDKAAELARIYHLSIDDLVGEQVELVVKEKKTATNRLLKCLEGKCVKLSVSDLADFIDMALDCGRNDVVRVLEVNEEWLRIAYSRKKEQVIRLVDVNAILGFEIVEEAQQ